jgi:hypothetical protein
MLRLGGGREDYDGNAGKGNDVLREEKWKRRHPVG